MRRARIPEDIRELILKCLACGVSASRIKEITGYEMETIKKLKGNYASHYKELCADYESGKFIADGVTDELAALVISSVLDGSEQEEDKSEAETDETVTVEVSETVRKAVEAALKSDVMEEKSVNKEANETIKEQSSEAFETRQTQTEIAASEETKPAQSEAKKMLKRFNDLYELLQWAMGSMTTDASKQGCREVLKEIRRMRVERYCKYVDWREIEEKL